MAFIVSPSGRKDELLAVADAARERGASVVAITASQTPPARKADVSLIVDHAEDVDLHLPMVSRVLHLLMIDIVTVGMAMQRLEPRARTVAPGVSAATPLANITSHSH